MDKNTMKYIQVNLPLTERDYYRGNGEGVWLLVDEKTKEAWDSDAAGPGYTGILDNFSLYYPSLHIGDTIPFEMRGEYRPVADYSFLSQLGEPTP